MTPHAVHQCLGCGQKIQPDEPEIRVDNTRGATKGSHRFRHADDEACQRALRGTTSGGRPYDGTRSAYRRTPSRHRGGS